jgi:transcriptional regulator with XRE-family HTH domain
MSLGAEIKKHRKLKGWTQIELSQQSGIDVRNLSRYETDVVQPRRGTLEKLAEVFDVAVDSFLEKAANGNGALAISDPELYEQFQQVAELNDEDRSALKRIISAVLVKNRIHSLTR